jgi:hypothetical protein
MKRHERPYGCTFPTCLKTFGSKNDWKRHENSQHFHLEAWRCDIPRLDDKPCAKVCYRRQAFSEHLKKEHQLTDQPTIDRRLENCRIGRNCQARFWCGFCIKLVELKTNGLAAWTERFDHIDGHFMGKDQFKKQGIQDWIPMDGKKLSENHPLKMTGRESKDEPDSPELRSERQELSNASSIHSSSLSKINKYANLKRPREYDSSMTDARPIKSPKIHPGYEKIILCVRSFPFA